jgi:tripartite-type tricarboxylate transporter receptor subunit TctC
MATIGEPVPSRRGFLKTAGIIAAGITAPSILRVRSAYAAYPDRPVKFVVANTPGGPSDIVARIVTAALQQSTGRTFIVENRGGAGGNIGMEYVARSDPDGYTILLATNSYSVNYGLYNQLPYDPFKDFVGVSELATSPNSFAVRSELPAKTMKDFISLARASPDKFNCATPPIGTTSQLQLELLKIRVKLPKLEDVVFKGGGEAIAGLLGGTAQMCSGSLLRRCRTSSPAHCAAWRLPATPAGRNSLTSPPWKRRVIRTLSLQLTAYCWHRQRHRLKMSNGWRLKH